MTVGHKAVGVREFRDTYQSYFQPADASRLGTFGLIAEGSTDGLPTASKHYRPGSDFLSGSSISGGDTYRLRGRPYSRPRGTVGIGGARWYVRWGYSRSTYRQRYKKLLAYIGQRRKGSDMSRKKRALFRSAWSAASGP